MSKPTNAERRRLAGNLRYLADYPGQAVQYAEQFRNLLEEGLLHDCEPHDYSEIFARLADLIEPEGSDDECAVHCKDCRYLDTMRCPVKRALVYDEVSPTAVIAPGGFCAWGKPKECK